MSQLKNYENDDPIVLVTGASGYVALHCVQQLLQQGYRVRGTVRSLKNSSKCGPLRAMQNADRLLVLVEADLMNAQDWPKVIDGCTFILHVASPWPIVADESTVTTAITGTMNVLKTAANCQSVRKIVLTSSCAAINDGHKNNERVFNENCWTDLNSSRVEYYARSKTMAEREAWNFWQQLPADSRYQLTCLNPTFVTGPCLSSVEHGSATIIGRMMNFTTFLAAPKVCLGFVDVRDVAKAHVLAMINPKTDGERILITHEQPVWFADVRNWLMKEFKNHGYLISPITAPNWMVKLYAKTNLDKQSAAIIHRIGPELKFSNKKSKDLLQMTYVDPRKSVIEMMYSMIDKGMVKSKSPLGCRVHDCNVHKTHEFKLSTQQKD
ncbi:NAD dependent epimerase/dehydratase family protein [Aphelenchoides besseyi]|nr:NAD dependent epimerase/dehydratase family protein [Aphelenchoides besseyi]